MRERRPEQGTVQINGSPSTGQPIPPAGTPPPASGAAPTVVAPAPAPESPPQPARPTEDTEYIDTRPLVPNQVVGVLVGLEGDLEGEVYRVFDGENRMGRSRDCEIELPSKKISREHAKLIHQDGVFGIVPLSDRNPTILNDEPTEGSELGGGDTIKLGRTTFRFLKV